MLTLQVGHRKEKFFAIFASCIHLTCYNHKDESSKDTFEVSHRLRNLSREKNQM